MVETPTNPDPAPAPDPKRPTAITPRRRISRVLTILGRLVVRAYAFVAMLVILWAGYAAVAYLIRSVFAPARTPSQFTGWAATLDARDLRSSEAAGVSVAAPRAPLGHYHGVDRWFEPDLHNNCTLSGCHWPLPHAERKEVRAFANFHVTFLACQMCHDKQSPDRTRIVWVGKTTGQPQGTPAILQLIKELEADAERPSTDPSSRHTAIVGLLRQVTSVIRKDPLLDYLLVQIETTSPGSPVWRQSVDQLEHELPNHLRGEYGAKLMTREDAGQSKRDSARMAGLARRFLAAGANSPQRLELHQEIHADVLARPGACQECHDERPARLDYDGLGYPRSRQTVLCGLPIAQMVQQIRAGQPFYLPGFVEPGRTLQEGATTRPR